MSVRKRNPLYALPFLAISAVIFALSLFMSFSEDPETLSYGFALCLMGIVLLVTAGTILILGRKR